MSGVSMRLEKLASMLATYRRGSSITGTAWDGTTSFSKGTSRYCLRIHRLVLTPLIITDGTVILAYVVLLAAHALWALPPLFQCSLKYLKSPISSLPFATRGHPFMTTPLLDHLMNVLMNTITIPPPILLMILASRCPHHPIRPALSPPTTNTPGHTGMLSQLRQGRLLDQDIDNM